jgi:hypothetical protein
MGPDSTEYSPSEEATIAIAIENKKEKGPKGGGSIVEG